MRAEPSGAEVRHPAGPPLAYERAFRVWAESRGMKWDCLRLAASADIRFVAYRVSPPAAPKAVVLALHGAGNDALFAWIGLFKRALARDVEIFTFDLPGHGRFGQGPFYVEAALRAIDAAVEFCRSARSSVPVHAVGVSLGGSVLLRSLPQFQTRLTSAVLMVAPLEINLSLRSVLPEISRRTISALIREREHYGWTGLIPSFGPFKRDVYPLRLRNPSTAGAFGYVRALNQMLREMELERAASKVRIPCLLMYGDRDRIVNVAQGRRLASIIPGAKFEVVAGGTHLSTPMEPAAVERVLSWIDR